MAHRIEQNDKQQGLEMAWHKLTEVLPSIDLGNCWLSGWDVRKERLYTGDMKETDYCQLVATDKPEIRIGAPVHCETYQPISNKDFLATVKEALADINGAKVASVGSLCNRGRVFVSVKLDKLPVFEAAGREHLAYLNFMNSHDQSTPFIVNTSNICTVCNNTFSANLRSKDKGAIRIKLKHTKNVKNRLDNIPEIIDGFIGAQAEFKAKLDYFRTKSISTMKAKHFIAGFIGGDNEGEMGTRKLNQVNRLHELFEHGAGNHGQDRSDVFNAITDYYTHESSGGENIMRQVIASEYGTGRDAKARAFSLLQNDEEVNALCAAGDKLLAGAI